VFSAKHKKHPSQCDTKQKFQQKTNQARLALPQKNKSRFYFYRKNFESKCSFESHACKLQTCKNLKMRGFF